MNVGPGIVRVPDLHISVAHRFPTRTQNAAADIRDLTYCRREVAIDHQQIVVRVQRQSGWVVRAFRLLGSEGELLRE